MFARNIIYQADLPHLRDQLQELYSIGQVRVPSYKPDVEEVTRILPKSKTTTLMPPFQGVIHVSP